VVAVAAGAPSSRRWWSQAALRPRRVRTRTRSTMRWHWKETAGRRRGGGTEY